MHRRNFLQASALAALALTVPRRARAQAVGGPRYLIAIDANGAWAPPNHCDPSPAGNVNYTPITAAQLLTTGALTYSPMPNGAPYTTVNGEDFFAKHFSRMTVI